MDTIAITPTEELLRSFGSRARGSNSFATRSVVQGGLGLCFHVRADGAVVSDWCCATSSESYEGIVHGGLQATALDSAMVHALFARGIVARTGELTVRYRKSVLSGRPAQVSAWLKESHGPLHKLEGAIHQDGELCAQAWSKFMIVPAGK